METKNSLKGKTVVVTGASKGLGRAITEEFASYEANVIAASRSVSNHTFSKNNILQVVTDVTKSDNVRSLALRAIKEYRTIDIWVNNAGILYRSPIEDFSDIDLRKSFETNVYGVFYGCREAVKLMKNNQRGHIINIISTSALIGKENESIYCSTKWAVKGLHESLKKEISKYNIRVSGLFVGGMKTNLFEKYQQDISEFMEPAEIARYIVLVANTPKEISPTEITLQRSNSIRA